MYTQDNNNMKTYSNNEHTFYILDDLINEYPKIYTGCRTKNDFIVKYKLKKWFILDILEKALTDDGT